MEPLKVEHLCKTYGDGENQANVLSDTSFTVEKGEFVVITGVSGSGKSTLLHIIGGVDVPDSGRVLVDGTEIHQKSQEELAAFRRRQVGLIYQFYNLIPVLNVEENITLPLKLDGQQINRQRLDKLIETLRFSQWRNHSPKQLPGGQQQRVSADCAFINAPALMSADEPIGNLDNKNSHEIIELLKYSNRTHRQTLLLATHNEEIALQADRIIQVQDGRIVSGQHVDDKRR